MASFVINGASMRSPSSLSEGSEESFVVLSRSMDPESSEQVSSENASLMPSLSNSIVCPTIPQVPVTDSVSQATSITSSSSTSTTELSAEEIQSKLESLLQENLQLKGTLQQNNLAMKKQFSTLVMWQEDVMKVHQSHKEKFEETKKLIANLRAENSELKKSASLPGNCSQPDEDILTFKSKISALEFELDTLRQGNIKFKNDQTKIIQELELKLSESEKSKAEEVTKLKIQIDSLNTQLKNVEECFASTQQKLSNALTNVPSAEEIQENENAKKQLTEMTTELVLKNKMLKEKTDLIDNLHEEISKLKIENETIPILKTQVDVYQTDFNAERSARNDLKMEKDRIAEDLHLLQRRNQKLLEEVERLRRDDNFIHVSQGYNTGNFTQQAQAASAPRDQSPPLAQFICPVCSDSFRSLRLLEDHIDSCIQNSA